MENRFQRAGSENSDGGSSAGSVQPQPKMTRWLRREEQMGRRPRRNRSGSQGEGGLGRSEW